jgi:signal transduction histidine kinase
MSAGRVSAVLVVALLCGAGVIALVLTGDHHADQASLWVVLAPLTGWSFIFTGLYAWRRRPESRTGALMVLMGFAWDLSALSFADSAFLHTFATVASGLWGGVFLHLMISFPSGRLASRTDRALVIAGYLTFTLGAVPGLLVATVEDLGCSGCPNNLLLIRRDEDLADLASAFEALLYAALFTVVAVRATLRWLRTDPLERLQLTPVYFCGLATFLLVTVGTAGAPDIVFFAGYIATALLPFAFLAGLLRTHLAQVDADLRASRARIVEASDTERRRLERNLHDGAQSRLLGVLLLLGQARQHADPETGALLERAQAELKTSLAELRELARGIHPAVLAERGLGAAVQALAARAPVPVTVESDACERLPRPVEVAAYFVVSEALANVAKYSQATAATVAVRRANGQLTIEVADDGVGGADVARGSGLRGLEDRVAALDGTLAVDSPAGHGTRLRAEIPVRT